MVFLVREKELRSFEISRSHSDVVFLVRDVEFCETKINNLELFLFMIDDNIVGLDVSMHNSHRIHIVERFKNF